MFNIYFTLDLENYEKLAFLNDEIRRNPAVFIQKVLFLINLILYS